MNIFAVDENPVMAAVSLCDKHVHKMAIESAQLLCAALWLHGPAVKTRYLCKKEIVGWEDMDYEQCSDVVYMANQMGKTVLYDLSHKNNRFMAWTCTSIENWEWLHEHACALAEERVYRFGKPSKVEIILRQLPKPNLPATGGLSPFCRCEFKTKDGAIQKDICEMENTVEAYREYYNRAKSYMAVYTRREPPAWYVPTYSSLDELIA